MRPTLIILALATFTPLPVQAKPSDKKVDSAINNFRKGWAKYEKNEDRKVILIRSLGQSKYHHPKVAEELNKYLTRDSLAIRGLSMQVLSLGDRPCRRTLRLTGI